VIVNYSPALVHDDVVDDSNRRRVFSINALWKNKIAVLLVTIYYQKLLLSIDNGDLIC
jgi:octaprenyl-diphosphate synthase